MTALERREDAAERVFRAGGEMGALMRAFDWSATPLGPVEGWSASLRTTAAMVVANRHPMFLWWGPELVQVYNDAYSRSIGPDRHPSAIGARGAECWAEIWPVIGPEVVAVYERGEAFWHDNHYVPITRGVAVEDVWWSYSYSPVTDDDGETGGVLVTVQETTRWVLAQRRAKLLQALSQASVATGSEREACAAAAAAIAQHPDDVPFALMYLRDAASGVLRRVGAVGSDPARRGAPDTLPDGMILPWPVSSVARGAAPVVIDDALVLPIVTTPAEGLDGIFVAGLNPRTPLDGEYRDWLEQVTQQIASAVFQARARAQERRSWRAAEQARAQLARVCEQAPVAIALLRGPDHVIEIANEQYVQIVGSHRELIGRPVREAFPELAGQGVYELLDDAYRTACVYRAQERPLRLTRAAGAAPEEVVYDWVYAPLVDDDGVVDSIAVVASDVTGLVRAREAAERAAAALDLERRRLLTVLDQSTLAIVIAEAPSGRLLFQNRVADALVSREGASAAWLTAAPHGLLVRALAGQTIPSQIVAYGAPSGSSIELSATAAPVTDAQGQIVAAVAIFSDVTEPRRLERELRDAQRLQAVGTLAGGMAHEVNNQMTVVLGFGEFVLRALGPDHPKTADLRTMLEAATRAATVTQQLLTFARRQVTRPRKLDLHSLVADLTPVLRQLLGSDKRLVIAANRATRLVELDRSQVEQVLINLVANARDATPTGGEVTIRVEDAELGPADAAARNETVAPGPYVRLVVADTGVGMDPHTMARVFEPFFTTKPVGQGTGLGLSMVYGVVKHGRGYIWADTELGRGTVMQLYWPAHARAERSDRGGGAGAPGERQRDARVLVVEDEPHLRELTMRMLEEEGYEVVGASHGQAALTLLERERFDLLLTDVMMPVMNGAQLAAAAATAWPEMPVLFMSGFSGQDVVKRHQISGAAPFLQKPFTLDALLRAVAALVPGAEPA